MSTTRLLIAVSSPWASRRLSESLASFAARLNAEAIVAHVARPSEQDEDQHDARQRGEDTLAVMERAFMDAGVTSESVLLFSDDVAKAILNTARARSCTLIVIGLGSKGVIRRMLEKNVPAEILKRAELPVLLCPESWVSDI